MTEPDDSPIIVAGPLDGAPGEARQRRWHYLPALDGVRALAVIAVVLFHFWPDAFPSGDVALHKALGLQDAPHPARAAESLSQAWRPWRSYAVLRAWHGLPTRLPPTGEK